MPNPDDTTLSTFLAEALPAEAIHLLSTALLRHLAHTYGLNESVLTGDRSLAVAIPDQSSTDPETPLTGCHGER